MPITKNASKKVVTKLAPKEEAPPKVVVEKLSRGELAELVREKVMGVGFAISEKVAQVAVVAFEEVIMEALVEGKQVSLPGFGSFSVVHRTAATRPNPQKPGELVEVPAHNAPKFKAGSRFKEVVKHAGK